MNIDDVIRSMRSEISSLKSQIETMRTPSNNSFARNDVFEAPSHIGSTSDDTYPFRVSINDDNRSITIRAGCWTRNGDTSAYPETSKNIDAYLDDATAILVVYVYIKCSGSIVVPTMLRPIDIDIGIFKTTPTGTEPLTTADFDEKITVNGLTGSPVLPNPAPNNLAAGEHGFYRHRALAYLTLEASSGATAATISGIRQLWRGGHIKDTVVIPDGNNDGSKKDVFEFSKGISNVDESGELQFVNEDDPDTFASTLNQDKQCLRFPSVASKTNEYKRTLYWSVLDGDEANSDNVVVDGVSTFSLEAVSGGILQGAGVFVGKKLQLYNFDDGARGTLVDNTMDVLIRNNDVSGNKELQYIDAYAFAGFCSAYNGGQGGGYGHWWECPYAYDIGDYFWHQGGDESTCYGSYIGNSSQGKAIHLDSQTLLYRWNTGDDFYVKGNVEIPDGWGVEIGGNRVIGSRLGAISNPAGGTYIDVEARNAIDSILSAMGPLGHGLIES